MRKSIKNYTSGCTINRSVSEIQNLLSAKGAEKIMVDYKNNEPTGIMFLISTPKGQMPIKLPVKTENVERIFQLNKKPKYDWMKPEPLNAQEKEQAKRTAWKNIYDWIDAQLALLETEMVKLEEIFLPYVVMGKQTVFEHFESGNLLASGKGD